MDSGFQTKILICADCGEEFVFTVAAQEYFAEKGYTEDPKLCKYCYMQRKRVKKTHGRELKDEVDLSIARDQ
jgi:hypothetical protein